jgi:xanthine/CO dehydrogenase XdhC/CoxF family maturation factor
MTVASQVPAPPDMSAFAAADAIPETAAAWRREGRQVALATVIDTWGSSPRPVGSQLLVDREGNMVGSVSGGCIEGAVMQEALAILDGAPPKLLEFGVSNEDAWAVGLACGGRVQIFVEAVE